MYRLNRALKRPEIDNYPVVAFVDPTLFCNLRCPACPTGAQAGLRPPALMPVELYRAFLDEVGDYLFKLYLYNLGEPLLHKQAPEMIAWAKSKGIFVMVSSNLSLPLTDEVLERLVGSGLDVLVVALDGTRPETYSRYRRSGDFELVRANMKKVQCVKQALGSRTPTVIWQFLVFEHNQSEIETVRREYRAWGADEYWLAGAYLPSGESAGLASSTIAGFNLYHRDHPHQKMTQAAASAGQACSWLYGVTVLSPNGRLSPCCYTAAEKDDFAEYFTDQGFMRAWNSEKYARARSLAAWKPGEDWEAIARRQDGRGASLALAPDQLICHRCPVPFLQDVVDHELTFEPGLLERVQRDADSLTAQEREVLEHVLRHRQELGL